MIFSWRLSGHVWAAKTVCVDFIIEEGQLQSVALLIENPCTGEKTGLRSMSFLIIPKSHLIFLGKRVLRIDCLCYAKMVKMVKKKKKHSKKSLFVWEPNSSSCYSENKKVRKHSNAVQVLQPTITKIILNKNKRKMCSQEMGFLRIIPSSSAVAHCPSTWLCFWLLGHFLLLLFLFPIKDW